MFLTLCAVGLIDCTQPPVVPATPIAPDGLDDKPKPTANFFFFKHGYPVHSWDDVRPWVVPSEPVFSREVMKGLGPDVMSVMFGSIEPLDPYGPQERHLLGYNFSFIAPPLRLFVQPITPNYQELKLNFERALRNAYGHDPLFMRLPTETKEWCKPKVHSHYDQPLGIGYRLGP